VVIAAGSLTFLQLWYYAPASVQSRLVYLASPDSAIRLTGSDTFDRGYLALSRWTRVPAQPCAPFVAEHDEFRVYQAGAGWLLTELQQQGAEVELAASEPGGQEYRVRMRGR